MLSKRLTVFMLLAALVGLGWQFQAQQSNQTTPVTQTDLAQSDWIMYHSESWRIERATPNQQDYLQAAIARQQADILYLQTPLFIRFEPDQQLQVRAAQAEIHQHNTFYFNGDGHILRQQADQQQHLYAERFVYQHDLQRLSSDDPVILRGTHYQSQGTGLIVQLDRRQLQLLSEVKTHYAP
jgi:LPS export ABC transporter protein LptC